MEVQEESVPIMSYWGPMLLVSTTNFIFEQFYHHDTSFQNESSPLLTLHFFSTLHFCDHTMNYGHHMMLKLFFFLINYRFISLNTSFFSTMTHHAKIELSYSLNLNRHSTNIFNYHIYFTKYYANKSRTFLKQENKNINILHLRNNNPIIVDIIPY